MASGRYTSRRLVELYTERIEAIDRSGPTLRVGHRVEPRRARHRRRPRRRAQERAVRGPLHGIPVLVKDNIDTADRMMTTAGLARARRGGPPRADAFIVAEAARGGRGDPRQDQSERVGELPLDAVHERLERPRRAVTQPYALDRNPCGSSSGTGAAVAANLGADRRRHRDRRIDRLARRTPTGSWASSRRSGWSAAPASFRSRTPRTRPGPMARTVTDAALAAGRDRRRRSGRSRDRPASATARDATTRPRSKPTGCKGARIGVARKRTSATARATDRVDRAAHRRHESARRGHRRSRRHCRRAARLDDCEFEVLLYEFKADLNKYLAARWASRRRSIR